MDTTTPFTISVQDPSPELRELHIDFTDEFRALSVNQRLESLRVYLESLVRQAHELKDVNSQRGVMTIIEITEQLLPHIQSDNLPLEQTLVVEMGEAAEGSDLNDLLGI